MARVLLAFFLSAMVVCVVLAVCKLVASESGQVMALERHRVTLAVIAACIAATLVTRRRSFERVEATRSWLAALPVRLARARCESVVIASAPACAMLLAVPLAALIAPRSAVTLLGGIVAGAVVGYLIPEAQVVDLPPGSRYVPYRRVTPKVLRPSLGALGLWPVRRLFASLRPQAVARVALPLLLAVPMGTTGATAMLFIGIFAAVTATALLVAAILAVAKAARRWLLPFPLSDGTIGAQVLRRSMVVMSLIVAFTMWLLWVAGLKPRDCAQWGMLLFLVAAASAVGGSRFLVGRAKGSGS